MPLFKEISTINFPPSSNLMQFSRFVIIFIGDSASKLQLLKLMSRFLKGDSTLESSSRFLFLFSKIDSSKPISSNNGSKFSFCGSCEVTKSKHALKDSSNEEDY